MPSISFGMPRIVRVAACRAYALHATQLVDRFSYRTFIAWCIVLCVGPAMSPGGCGREPSSSQRESQDVVELKTKSRLTKSRLRVKDHDDSRIGSATSSDRALGVIVPDRVVELGAQRAGRIESIAVRFGQTVEAGALLAALDKKELLAEHAAALAVVESMKAQCRSARLQTEQAASNKRRRENIKGLYSPEEIEQAQSTHQIAEVRVVQCDKDLNQKVAQLQQLEVALRNSELRAPFAGTVSSRYLSEGATVSLGQPVMRLISDGPALLRFAVPEHERPQIGQQVCATGPKTSGRPKPVSINKVLAARVSHVAPEIDDALGLVVVEALLDAPRPSDFTFGMQVDVAVHCPKPSGEQDPARQLARVGVRASSYHQGKDHVVP